MPFSFSDLMGHSNYKSDNKNLSCQGVWAKKFLESQNFLGWLLFCLWDSAKRVCLFVCLGFFLMQEASAAV